MGLRRQWQLLTRRWQFRGFSSRDWRRRVRAVERLSRWESADAVDPLIGSLWDDRAEVRASAVAAVRKRTWEGLEAGAVERCVAQFIEALEASDRGVRCAAAEALGTLRAPEAVEPLGRLMGGTDVGLRTLAIEALGRIPSAAAFEHLCGALHHADAGLRIAAAKTVARERGWGGLALLLPLLLDPVDAVRSAVGAVVRQVDSEWARSAAGQAMIPLFGSVLGDPSSVLRREAALLLGEIGDASCVEPLLGRLGDEAAMVREAAVVALVRTGRARLEPALAALLVDSAASVRVTALRALEGIDAQWMRSPVVRACAERFTAAVQAEDGEVRKAAVEVLGKIGWREGVAEVIASLQDDYWPVRDAAATALGMLGGAEVRGPLRACLTDTNYLVRRSATEALDRLDPHWSMSSVSGG